MDYLTSPKGGWNRFSSTLENIAAGLTADIDTYALAYSGTWATGAQNPAIKPSLAVTRPQEANAIILMFAVANAADEVCAGTLWTWRTGDSPAMDTLVINPIVAGTTLVSTDPVNGDTLSLYYYADAITVTTDNSFGGATVKKGTANGIALLMIDAFGIESMFFDYDFDAASGSGTPGTDCIVYWSWA